MAPAKLAEDGIVKQNLGAPTKHVRADELGTTSAHTPSAHEPQDGGRTTNCGIPWDVAKEA